MVPLLATPPAPAPTPIPKIQGRTDASPLAGQDVRSGGIVTGVYTYVSPKGVDQSGLYVQDPRGDGDAATSDALFVLTSGARDFKVGDVVGVEGRVEERYGMTSIVARQVTAEGARRAVPKPIALQMGRDQATGEAALEALEGMRVTLPNAMAMGPATSFGFAATDEAVQGARRRIDGVRSAQVIDVSADLGVATNVKTGDRVSKVEGPITWAYGGWRLLQTARGATVKPIAAPPRMWGDVDGDDRITVADLKAIEAGAGSKAIDLNDPRDLDADGAITGEDVKSAEARANRRTGAPTFRIANFNVENLFDTVDDPDIGNEIVMSRADYRAKLTGIARTIVDVLGAPSIVTLQEVENATVLRDLVARPELAKRGYRFAHLESIDPRGIDVAVLYRGDSVKLEGLRQAQGQTTLAGKDDHNRHLGPKPLFMRPPLIADLAITDAASGQKQLVTLVTNHFMSKYSPGGAPTEPWRIEQAKFTVDLVEELRAANPGRGVIVAGDLNDNDTSEMQRILTSSGLLTDLGQAFVPQAERFTYNFKGTAQSIDHMLVTPDLRDQVEAAGVRHVHTDLPEIGAASSPARVTDHDLFHAELRFGAAPKG